MNGLNALKGWIGALTEVALMLLALGIVLALLAGPPGRKAGRSLPKT